MIKPLTDKSLCFETCLIMRADQDSRAVNEYARAFLKKYAPQLRRRKADGFAATRLIWWRSPRRSRFSYSIGNRQRCSFNSNGVPSTKSGR